MLWRSRVSYTVCQSRYAMPLSLSFVLIGFFLWVAENAATLLGAWQYPDQAQIWQMVHVGKWGSWALLVSLSFVLVAAVKMQEGRFYGEVGPVAAVKGATSPSVRVAAGAPLAPIACITGDARCGADMRTTVDSSSLGPPSGQRARQAARGRSLSTNAQRACVASGLSHLDEPVVVRHRSAVGLPRRAGWSTRHFAGCLRCPDEE